jgi:hypothetical protein
MSNQGWPIVAAAGGSIWRRHPRKDALARCTAGTDCSAGPKFFQGTKMGDRRPSGASKRLMSVSIFEFSSGKLRKEEEINHMIWRF